MTGLAEIRSRNFAQRLISSGKVTVNGAAATKHTRLAPGQIIAISRADLIEEQAQAESIPLDIKYEDDDLIVVSKPAGLVTHPGVGNLTGTLVNALLAHTSLASVGAPLRPGIIHRLDKNTSGLIVAAKTDDAYYSLINLMAKREIKRYYQTLVAGRFNEISGEIIAPIGRSQSNRQLMSVLSVRGREAKTYFKVIEQFNDLTLLEVSLDTGRTHQIRVHMRFINHQVVGDPVYGSAKLGRELGINRQFLHAWKLEFNHPKTNEPLSFVSELPPDLANVLNILRKREKAI